MAEAVDSHIGGWFWNAAARARIRPVAQPQYDYELPADDEGRLAVHRDRARPAEGRVVDWTELEVGKPEAEVPEELVDAGARGAARVGRRARARRGPAREGGRHARRRHRLARRARPSATRSSSSAPAGSSRRSRRRSSALPPARRRASPTSSRTSRPRRSTITVKEISEKVLPELDDELARSASEFDTLGELRADIEQRLREASRRRSRTRSAPTRSTRSSPPRRSRRPGRSSSRAHASCSTASSGRSSAAGSRPRPTCS